MLSSSRPRILQGATATVSYAPRDADGETIVSDPGVVTIHITRSDGTDVVAAGTATVGSGTSPRTYQLTATATALLDVLSIEWSVAGIVVARSSVETVGGFLFLITELRTAEKTLAATDQADLLRVRTEVESSFESWTNLAFVPRFAVVDAHATEWSCRLLTDKFYIRTVRWARLWTSDAAFTALTVDECAAIRPSDSGLLERSTGWGCGRVQLGVEYGLDAPPGDGKRMALLYARICALRSVKGISGAAVSFTTPEGQQISYEPNVEPTNYKVINEFLRRQDVDHRIPGTA